VEPYVTVDNIESKVPAWLKQIRPYNQHEMRLNVAASALLVIDVQRFFLDATSSTYTCGGVAILPTVKRLMDSFRRAGRPVIFTRHVHHPGDLDSGIMGVAVGGQVSRRQSGERDPSGLGSDAWRESRL
jgi:nicotinamidase-related amidase